MINLWYHESSNFGDMLSKYITEKLSRKNVCVVPRLYEKEHYIVIGSILSSANEHSIVWGAGFSQENETLNKVGKIHMVRGHLSRNILLKSNFDCPEFVGDSAWIMPKLFHPKVEVKYKYGMLPHWVDYEQCVEYYGNDDNVLIINLLCDNIEDVIMKILSCEKIISSSLHGLVVAHAYNIPSLWVEFSDKVIGNGFKFVDYYSSIGIDNIKPFNLREKISVNHIYSNISQDMPTCDSRKMLDCCPFTQYDNDLVPVL